MSKTINLNVLYDHFGYDDGLYRIAEDIFSRMDEISEDDLSQAMDEALIWTSDQWAIVEAYCTPQSANYDEAWECFYGDLCSALSDGVLEDEEEDEEDE